MAEASFLVASEAEGNVTLALASRFGLNVVTRVELIAGFHLAVHPSLPFAYLTSGAEGGSVVTVGLAGTVGEVGRVTCVGRFPCMLAVSPDGSMLATANYEGGSVSFLDLEEGIPIRVSATVVLPYVPGGTDGRQDAAYPHTVHWVSDQQVLVPDLGGDTVWRVDAALGSVESAFRTPPGSGPRHLARDRHGLLWVSLELSSEAGRLVAGETVTAPATLVELEEGVRNYPGDIVAAGAWVVMANRGADTLALYGAGTDEPALAAEVPSGGRWPADLAVSGTTLAVALRDSNQVSFFDVSDAGLTAQGVVTCPRPIAIVSTP